MLSHKVLDFILEYQKGDNDIRAIFGLQYLKYDIKVKQVCGGQPARLLHDQALIRFRQSSERGPTIGLLMGRLSLDKKSTR